MDIYQKNGYNNRKEYLQELASKYGVSEETVFTCAELMGETEDFDGLLSMLEDAEKMGL